MVSCWEGMIKSSGTFKMTAQDMNEAIEAAHNFGARATARRLAEDLEAESRKPTTERRTLAEMAEAIRRMYL